MCSPVSTVGSRIFSSKTSLHDEDTVSFSQRSSFVRLIFKSSSHLNFLSSSKLEQLSLLELGDRPEADIEMLEFRLKLLNMDIVTGRLETCVRFDI